MTFHSLRLKKKKLKGSSRGDSDAGCAEVASCGWGWRATTVIFLADDNRQFLDVCFRDDAIRANAGGPARRGSLDKNRVCNVDARPQPDASTDDTTSSADW